MLFLTRNDELIKDREKTLLTAPIAVGGVTATVRAVDAAGGTTSAWNDNDYIIIGEIGAKNAELLQINGAVADGTTITFDQSGAGGARFVHAVDEPVYRIDYNMIEMSGNTAATSVGTTVIALNEIQVDDLYTRYEDADNLVRAVPYTHGFTRWNNGANYSDYSDPIPYTGYTPRSLGRIMKMVRRHLDEEDFRTLRDEDIIEEINEKQRHISHERLWSFYEDIFSDSTVANTRQYDIDNDVVVGKSHTVVVRGDPMAKISRKRWNMLHWDTVVTGDPTHVHIWNNDMYFYPTPSAAASTDTVGANIAIGDVTITGTSTSGFQQSGRILINDEVISYDNISATQFLGCKRGLEETTAAAHVIADDITERDIVYTANREPNELRDTMDETAIPDPLALVYGTAMELALGKLDNQGMHDRMKLKYDQAMDRLRDKFGRKQTSSYFTIKDKDDYVRDIGSLRDPNQYPTNIG